MLSSYNMVLNFGIKNYCLKQSQTNQAGTEQNNKHSFMNHVDFCCPVAVHSLQMFIHCILRIHSLWHLVKSASCIVISAPSQIETYLILPSSQGSYFGTHDFNNM